MSSGRGPFGLPKVHEEERRRALEDPGVSWKDWLSSSFAKTYLGLAFFIADGLLIASWFGPPANYPAMIGTTALALYLEYLAWQYPMVPAPGVGRGPRYSPGHRPRRTQAKVVEVPRSADPSVRARPVEPLGQAAPGRSSPDAGGP